MKTSYLFLLLLSLSFNSTIHATNNKCQKLFHYFSAAEKNQRKVIKAIKTSNLKALQTLIENKEINLQWKHPSNESTLLHLAARYSKNPGIIEALIKAGIDLKSQDSEGNTALHIAIKRLNTSAVRAIVTQADKQDETTELFSIQNKNKKNIHTYTYALNSSHSHLSRKLPQEQKKALKRITFMIESAKSEDKKMRKAVKNSDVQTMERLIKREKIDFKKIKFNNSDPTLLHLAVQFSKDPRVIEILIAAEVDINSQDFSGDTALHKSAKFNTNAIKVLAAAGGDLTIKNFAGEPALHTAIRFNNELSIRAIKEAGGDLTIADNEGNTALHLAAKLNHEHLVKLFMQEESSLALTQNNRGETALHLAVRNKNLNLVKILLQYENSFLAIQNNNGDTALHLAIDKHLIDIAEALLKAKAPLRIKNIKGEAPFDFLKKWENIFDLYKKTLAEEL